MPQFDQSSFLNQVFWFLIFFLSFYFFISYYFLPNICVILKIRNKKIDKNEKNLLYINFEKTEKNFQTNVLYNVFFNKFDAYLKGVKNKSILGLSNVKTNHLTNKKLNESLISFLCKYNKISK
jgi:hypothetical protein